MGVHARGGPEPIGLGRQVVATAAILLATAAACLPRRLWRALDVLPVARLSVISALVTTVIGLAMGAGGYLSYARHAASLATDATLAAAARQVAGQIGPSAPITTAAPIAVSMLSLAAFALFTPLGLFATYLTASGLLRILSGIVDDPMGDPALTVLDALALRARERVTIRRKRSQRLRLEGPDAPDRLALGEQVGFPDADYVVIAARRKADWRRGTFVITSQAWYTLGEPLDREFPEGLRTLYPLTEQTVNEVLRRGVRYELPPLDAGPPRRPDRGRAPRS